MTLSALHSDAGILAVTGVDYGVTGRLLWLGLGGGSGGDQKW